MSTDATEPAQPGPLLGVKLTNQLGPLPEPAERERVYGGHGNEVVHEYYTASQMREYARQHVYLCDEKLLAEVAKSERRAEPLRRLGARLASLLDEDQWAECEALLLEAGARPNVAIEPRKLRQPKE